MVKNSTVANGSSMGSKFMAMNFKNHGRPSSGKNNNKEPTHVNKSYSMNRQFGKDITNKILNSSGAVALPN